MDVVIIGGGLTGMSCALHAVIAGLNVVVFEARGLADGATGRNGGHQWPEGSNSQTKLMIENEDVKAVRCFIACLSEEWQKKIDLRVNGGLHSFFKNNYLPEQEGLCFSKNDPDVPEIVDGAHYNSCAA